MGDVIEISTWPGHRNIFYKISTSGFIFDLRTESGGAIGLAKKPGLQCDVWVVIGHNGHRSWIKKDEGGVKSSRTPNILSGTEYRRFWLLWRNGWIQLGRYNEKTPILSCNNNIDLNYVTFSAAHRGRLLTMDRHITHWRIELPPVFEKPKLKSVTGGELQWVHADNHLPDGALIGGYEKETLYIIRASHRGSLSPGKFVPSQGTGYISWGGEAHEKNQFEVLCGFDCTWVPTVEDRIPVGAVEGGFSEREREKIYIGRVLYNGHLIPGKVQPSHRVCYIAFEGKEIGQKKFEILVSPDRNVRSVNKVFIDHIDVESPPESDNDDEEPQEIDMYDEMNQPYEVILD